MAESIDKGIPLMKPTFFDDNDPNNPKKKTYIEREALMCVIEKSRRDNPHRDLNVKRIHDHEHRHFLGLVENQPTADVVKVVKCIHCIHFKTNISKENYCDIHSTTWDNFMLEMMIIAATG